MKILVTGGGGFLGFYIIKELLNDGHKVTNFSRSSYPQLEKLGVPTITGNLNQYSDLLAASAGIEAIFHVASKIGMAGKWNDFYQTNIVGTDNVIKCCQERNIKYLVYTSTPSVAFGKHALLGVNESTPIPKRHLNHYARSKARAEKKVLQVNGSGGLHTVALRPHLIFGPGDTNLIPGVIKAAQTGRLRIVGNGENLVDVIYVENAAKAHVQAFYSLQNDNKVAGNAYFIGQQEPVKLWDFINLILQKKSLAPISQMVSLKAAYRIGAVLEVIYSLFVNSDKEPPMTRFMALQLGTSHYFSHQKAYDDFGFDPQISTSEGLDRLFLS